VDFTLTNDFMTKNPATEQSMLAPHRVKPYHFKGLNDEQQAAILHERDQQFVEQALLKRQREEEDRLWALQQEHNRHLQVINDHDLKRQQRAMAESTKETHALQSLGLGLADTQAPKCLEVKHSSRRQVPADYEKIYSPKATPRSVTVPKRRL
jgi:hypothetical protein